MGWLRDAAVIDFETLPIHRRPNYPPRPVGVAISVAGRKPRYYAWGHPAKNNCGYDEGRQALAEVWDSDRPLLFHHAKFDVEVGVAHMGMPFPVWHRIHDTLPMLFLDDPRAPSFQLKASAERLLDEPPEERDAVVQWLVDHQPLRGIRLSDRPKSDHYAGAHICLAPGDIAGRYAIGDVRRTKRLARLVYARLDARKMIGPYNVERELMPYLLEMEKQGVRVDIRRLERDVERYGADLNRLDEWLRRTLRADDINIDSSNELAHALVDSGYATEESLGVTATGVLQTNKAALERGVLDPQLRASLKHRAQLATCLRTFMRPWLAVAEQSGGLIFTEWHSTRSDGSGGGKGARTGRLSSTPCFQNLVKAFAPLFKGDRDVDLPEIPIRLSDLPAIRSYVIPYGADDVFIDRDISQQELRILGHYEDGPLKQIYLEDVWADLHAHVQVLVNDMLHTNFERRPIKNTNFGLIYGMGVGKLAESSGISVETARQLKESILRLFPGLKSMYREMRRRADLGIPIRTWDGREYYCEPPRVVKGKIQTYDYKMVNLLIQGSAAGCTKRATLNYCKVKPRHHRLHLITHDQLTASVPRGERDSGMDLMRVCMEAVKFDIPMLTEGKWSAHNWGRLVTYDKKGKRHAR